METLKERIYLGAERKGLSMSEQVSERIDYELSIIEKYNSADYFILASDVVQICDDLNILRTFGRTKESSSLVNYCLDITNINPLEENLIFEQFVYPPEQFPYIEFNIPKGERKVIINELKRRRTEYNYFSIAYLTDETNKKGIVHKGVTYKENLHSFVAIPQDITVSTFQSKGKEYCISKSTKDLFSIGKVICLFELDTLNILQRITNIVGNDFHPYKLPLDDERVFELLSLGYNEGTFFQDRYTKEIFTKLKPKSIRDLSIANVLAHNISYLNYFSTLLSNRDKYNFGYDNPHLNYLLEDCYGVFLYQEMFMHIAKEFAGIPYLESKDWIMKIGKDKTLIKSFDKMFYEHCKSKELLDDSDIMKLVCHISEQLLEGFYQKGTSLTFSILAYWYAYYKTHFTKEFYEVLIEFERNGFKYN